MSAYYCKCGRIVRKATTGDNTGNRQTEDCAGCPYLFPWGPMKYTPGKGYQTDVQGYECRMSKDIDYTTRFSGSVTDKCTCYIVSLDFEFLERVSSWIAETYPNREIFGPFSKDTIRAVEYVSNGRYRMCITCTQNKAGMAAKFALLTQFFNPDGSRKDLAPEAEKQLILDRIAAGKAAAQEKETPCAEASLSPTTSPTPTAAPLSIQSPATAPTASTGTPAPGGPDEETAAGRAYRSTTGMVYAVRKHSDEMFRIMCHYDGEEWMLATSPQFSAPCKCAESLQEVLDAYASRTGWKEIETECKKENPADAPTPAAAAITTAPAAAPAETSTTSESEADASRCGDQMSGSTDIVNLSVQNSPAASEPVTQSPSGAAAACSAAGECSCVTCTYTGCHDQCFGNCQGCGAPVNHCNSYQADRWSKDAAYTAVVPASNETPEIVDEGSGPMPPAFDYSTLPEITAQHLHNLAERALRLTRNYYLDLMEIVVEAHRELCGTVVHDVDNGHFAPKEDTFRAWCSSIGVSKSRAYQLLQIQYIMDNSTPDEQENLAGLPYTTIREISKSNTPPEIVQAARQGDITTHKQYQEALARIKALTEERDQARREKGELAADCNRLGRQAEKALSDKREAEQAAAAAEKQRDDAQQTAQDAQARIRELESRPLEVVGASPEDIAKWRAEGAAAAKKELQGELRQAQKEAAEQRRRAETAEEDSEQAAQEALNYAAQLGQARRALEQGEGVRMVRQAVDACEALLRPRLDTIGTLDQADCKAAMDLLEELRDKLTWATMNMAWPGDDWPDGYYEDDGADEWEDEEA